MLPPMFVWQRKNFLSSSASGSWGSGLNEEGEAHQTFDSDLEPFTHSPVF
jgi:hypothetical protein